MNTKLFKARPTVYNGIQMRSRLEATTAASLDEHQVEWRYEPRAYANGTGQYLPDFEIQGGFYFLEVKGLSELDDRLWEATKRMEIIWSSVPDAYLILDAFSLRGRVRAQGCQGGKVCSCGWDHPGLPGWFPRNEKIDIGEMFCEGQCDRCLAQDYS